MFINNGFTFLNQYGHYTDISPYNNKKDGYIYKERDLGAIDVYAQEKANETKGNVEKKPHRRKKKNKSEIKENKE